MNRRTFTTTVLASAAGLAVAGRMKPASAEMTPMMKKMLEEDLKMHPGANKEVIMKNMERKMKYHLVKCYGVNAAGRNDCASGAHSCAGQARARDPNSFVLLPAGDCRKIAGGSLRPGKA